MQIPTYLRSSRTEAWRPCSLPNRTIKLMKFWIVNSFYIFTSQTNRSSPAVFFFSSLTGQQEGYNDYVTPELAPCVRKYHFYFVSQYLFESCGLVSTPCGLTILTVIIHGLIMQVTNTVCVSEKSELGARWRWALYTGSTVVSCLSKLKITFYYMASSVSGQDESNLALWLATWA